jgi:hypothetical protein
MRGKTEIPFIAFFVEGIFTYSVFLDIGYIDIGYKFLLQVFEL